ncbi:MULTISPECIES: MFS transporter [Paraburkholderia]|uniref:MFS transporter n=1 Tax=Paraburkholderia TaxID=1822464 RepID=UPI00225BA0F9|nr:MULTISPECIES: MFS transporter [Paraburkholderia]MCX4161371.1 MFS transporter [Paraburkholderia megapolitana]MDN7156867.1 MFS transporter [Paraburkholderia sp. CHISQ3]MDQ6493912.1 MFS transporter [Paraburkholderia megapolitana]
MAATIPEPQQMAHTTQLPSERIAGRQLATGVSLLYLALYFHFGFFAWMPVWLKDAGSSATEIGTLISIPLILRILTVAPFAAWCGRHGRVRNGIALTVFSAAVVLVFFPQATTHWSRLALFLVFSIIWDQIPVLMDAYAILTVRSRKLDFGRLRVWGSIAVIASSGLAGWVIEKLGIKSLPWAIAVLLLFPLAILPLLPRDSTLVHESSHGSGSWREIFRDRTLMSVLITASLLMGSSGVITGFGSIQWKSAGIHESTIGILNAISVSSEIVIFTFGAKLLGKRDPRIMMVIGALFSALRWAIMATSPALPMLVFAQILQCFLVAGALLAPVLMIASRVEDILVPSAQGLYAVLLGATLAAVIAGSGWLWQLGPAKAYLAMAVLALLSLPVLASSWRRAAA